MRSSAHVNTATDAAVAMNSVQFMELLSSVKNTVDIKTYIQDATTMKKNAVNRGGSSLSAERIVDSDATLSADNNSSKYFFSWMFGKGAEPEINNISSKEHDCLSTSNKPKFIKSSTACTTHETVSEYVGRLWFLPDSKGGIKFRETIKVLSISHDGQSSTVECITRYYNGSRWIDCSKIICQFKSIEHHEGDKQQKKEPNNEIAKDSRRGVKMTLDCEILVWLPLPKAASKAVKKKISSVFETVALDFFEELAE